MAPHLSEDEYLKIEELATKALNARTKNDARPFFEKLKFLQQNSHYSERTNIIFAQLVAYVDSGRGQKKDKKNLLDAAQMELYKLHREVRETEEEYELF